MTSQWDRYSDRLALEHRTSWDFPRATFFNYTTGEYDPDTGDMTGQDRELIGELDVELLPPQADSSVEVDGTDLSFDTSIRFPIGSGDLTVGAGETVTIAAGETQTYDTVTVDGTLNVNGTLIAEVVTGSGTVNGGNVIALSGEFATIFTALGEDNRKPSEVEVEGRGETQTYELHTYSKEYADQMLMCRLVEL
jgi:hypothetical protein